MIKDLDNTVKIANIFDIIKNAQEMSKKMDCKITFISDHMAYGPKVLLKVSNPKDCKFYFDDKNIIIFDGPNTYEISWWDIIQVNINF